MVCEPVVATPPVLSQTPSPAPASSGRALLESHLDLIQKRLAQLSRRSGLPEHEAEDLRSWALLKLIEDDYRVLASWRGRSSFSTFLTVVLVNLMRDYRIHVWGKWRPSMAARRRGPEAVLLERLRHRERLSLDEAITRLRGEHGVALSRAELEALDAELPRRAERWQVGEGELQQVAVDGQVEARVEERERAAAAARLGAALRRLLRALPSEERLLLKLHYRDGLSMAAIAPLLGRSQRELYSWRDRCLKRLRRTLEGAGMSVDRVSGVIGSASGECLPGLFAENGGIWE